LFFGGALIEQTRLSESINPLNCAREKALCRAAEKQKEIKWKIRATAIYRPPLEGFEHSHKN
jgi:hypothetical protein